MNCRCWLILDETQTDGWLFWRKWQARIPSKSPCDTLLAELLRERDFKNPLRVAVDPLLLYKSDRHWKKRHRVCKKDQERPPNCLPSACALLKYSYSSVQRPFCRHCNPRSPLVCSHSLKESHCRRGKNSTRWQLCSSWEYRTHFFIFVVMSNSCWQNRTSLLPQLLWNLLGWFELFRGGSGNLSQQSESKWMER